MNHSKRDASIQGTPFHQSPLFYYAENLLINLLASRNWLIILRVTFLPLHPHEPGNGATLLHLIHESRLQPGAHCRTRERKEDWPLISLSSPTHQAMLSAILHQTPSFRQSKVYGSTRWNRRSSRRRTLQWQSLR